jgi:hypothetical protein
MSANDIFENEKYEDREWNIALKNGGFSIRGKHMKKINIFFSVWCVPVKYKRL